MLTTLLLAAFAYSLGSLSGSLLVGRLLRTDIREHGSGNAGGTNALRILGWRLALAVVVIDIAKGALASGLALRLAPAEGPLSPEALGYLAGLLAVIGHCWPIWHGFRGGKGGATLVGALLALWPLALIPMLATWFLVLGIRGFVGLATITAAWALPAFAAWQGATVGLAFGLAAAALITFTHRGNLSRMVSGTEPCFERARVLRLFRRGPTG
ncbi:MAG: glycerol-3-phosphate 1-O-acyltransferase PlsY [Xanthomonadaceae bacterium]|nr:glycerol-3-phosphate 1-O-acyltransferase PlsY [Xanthomonadaceae bacterium]